MEVSGQLQAMTVSPPRKNFRHPWNKRLDGTLGPVRAFWRREKIFPKEIRVPDPPARSVVITTNTQPGSQNLHWPLTFTVTFRFMLCSCEMTQVFVRNEKNKAIIMLKALTNTLQIYSFWGQAPRSSASPYFTAVSLKYAVWRRIVWW
jgi:hypothetical protein